MPINDLQARRPSPKAVKPYKGLPMEGPIASWYTKIRQNDEEIAPVVRQVHERLPTGGQILEVAPGPGYLAIELAKLGIYQVRGLDISKSFVQIASAKAKQAGVAIDFQQGDASNMPFESGIFDLVLCRAAFKNFTAPVQAIQEMYRVLKPGGTALIIDLRRDSSQQDINAAVNQMGLGPINSLLTKFIFKHTLLKNAYTAADIQQFVAQTPFPGCEIHQDYIGMNIWLKK